MKAVTFFPEARMSSSAALPLNPTAVGPFDEYGLAPLDGVAKVGIASTGGSVS